MYVPAPPAPSVTPLIPVGIGAGAPLVAPLRTKLKVKRLRLDVLSGQRTSVAGGERTRSACGTRATASRRASATPQQD